MTTNGDETIIVAPKNIQKKPYEYSSSYSYTDWKVSDVVDWCSKTLNISEKDPLCTKLREDEITGDILADLALDDCKELCGDDLQKAVRLKLSLNKLIGRDATIETVTNSIASNGGHNQEETVTVTVSLLQNLYSALSQRLRVYEQQYAQLKDDVMETIKNQSTSNGGSVSAHSAPDLVSPAPNSRKISISSANMVATQQFEHPEATLNSQQQQRITQLHQHQHQHTASSASSNGISSIGNNFVNHQPRKSASSVSLGRPPSRGRPRPPSSGNNAFGHSFNNNIAAAAAAAGTPSLRALNALSRYGPPPLPPRSGSLLSRGNEPLKQLRASKDDSCEKILKNAMRRHNLTDQDWRQYVLVISYGDKERTLELTDKPVVIFKSLKQQGLHPTIMLRRKGDFEETRDYNMNDNTSAGEVSGLPDPSTITPGGRL